METVGQLQANWLLYFPSSIHSKTCCTHSINLTKAASYDYFLAAINWTLFLAIDSVKKNVFLEPTVTSSDCFFCPKPQDASATSIIYIKEQQIPVINRLESANV